MNNDLDDFLNTFELSIIDNNYKKEFNRFLSVEIDTRYLPSPDNLKHDQKMQLIINFYKSIHKYTDRFAIASGIDTNSINYEEKFNKDYKLNEFDELIVESFYSNINKNLLFFKKDISNSNLPFISLFKERSCPIATNLIGFLNLDFNKFNDYFKFFLTFLGYFTNKMPKKYLNNIFLNQVPTFRHSSNNSSDEDDVNDLDPIDIKMLEECAKCIYKSQKKYMIKMQKIFIDFVEYIFNINKKEKLKPFSAKQRFYVYTNICSDLSNIMDDYSCDYELKYNFFSKDFDNDVRDIIVQSLVKEKPYNLAHSEDFLYDSIKKYDSDNTNINGYTCTFITKNIYTYFYIVLYYLTLSNSGYIQKCKYCGKYFFTEKLNVAYCDNLNEDLLSCREIGSKLSQKIKEKNNPVYGKYRRLYAKKAMMAKRNPDIESYKINYEKWKKEANEFMKDIKNGTKTYEEFDKWLDKNK